MESSLQALQPLLIFVILALSLLSLLAFSFYHSERIPYPPGPKVLPIIGNLLMVNQLDHPSLAHLAKTHGGIVHLKMGRVDIVSISKPEMAQEVLQAQDLIFSNRPATMSIRYLTYDRADMAFAHYSPFWRRMRKICVMKLFSRKQANAWAYVREEVGSLVQTLSQTTGSPVNLTKLLFNMTSNMTLKAAFGSTLLDSQEFFVSIVKELSLLFGATSMADFMPWLEWIVGKGLKKRLVQARQSLDVFIDKLIDDHVEKKGRRISSRDETETDMVDELLAFYSEKDDNSVNSDDSQSSLKLTRDNIKGIIMDVMFGGTETIAIAADWTMSELMKNPEELKRVQRELTNLVGLDQKVQESHLERLTFLKCVIKESLRLHPPFPVLLHETSQDTFLSGYKIPAKSKVMINAWAIGRDPMVWDEPERFKPTRFLDSRAPDYKGNDFNFIPFGSGRRSCPGMQLGIYALELALASLLHCFNWELPDGMVAGDLDMSDGFGLTVPRAVPLILVPSPRHPCLLP